LERFVSAGDLKFQGTTPIFLKGAFIERARLQSCRNRRKINAGFSRPGMFSWASPRIRPFSAAREVMLTLPPQNVSLDELLK
jgi:hypothetical protein